MTADQLFLSTTRYSSTLGRYARNFISRPAGPTNNGSLRRRLLREVGLFIPRSARGCATEGGSLLPALRPEQEKEEKVIVHLQRAWDSSELSENIFPYRNCSTMDIASQRPHDVGSWDAGPYHHQHRQMLLSSSTVDYHS